MLTIRQRKKLNYIMGIILKEDDRVHNGIGKLGKNDRGEDIAPQHKYFKNKKGGNEEE